ncbi:MAG: hypothetical protein CL993_02865 [Euryarchaeota archaeon]|nr:hypothetical protein [Euryarchaeota archaeon]
MSSNTSERKKVMIIALLGASAISFAPLFYTYSSANPLTGAFFRMFYALPVFMIMIFLLRFQDNRNLRTRIIAILAGFILALDFVAYHSAIDYVGSGIATLIGNSQVIIVTLFSWKFLGEKPNKSIIFALPIVMFGLVFISGIWDNNAYGNSPIKGVFAAIIGAFFYSSFLIIYRFANREMAPTIKLQFDATAGATIALLALGTLPLQSLEIYPIDFPPPWAGHEWLFILAIICQVFGWMAITYALPRLPGSHTSFAVLVQPVLTIVWGVIFLDESPSIQQSMGMLMILFSIILVTIFGNIENSEE